MKIKKIIVLISLLVFLAAGIWAVVFAYRNILVTYDGNANAAELYNNPQDYDVSDPDGIADIIVKENLDKTGAANNVAAVVFDFRGYDTLGEAFILVTAIAGSFVILSVWRKRKEGDTK